MKKKVLFVCLGNICRSPAAEAVFWSLVNQRNCQNKFEVDSAGTGAWHVGEPADQRMRHAAKRRGIIISSSARQIKLDDFNYYDLIVTMDNQNLDNVISLSKALNNTFKAEIKPMLSCLNDKKNLEVPDPYYGGENGFDTVLDLLEEACEELILNLISKD